MSQIAYYLVVLCLGLSGAGLLYMAVDAPAERSVYTLALLVLNYFALLSILFMVYTVTGFAVHPCCGAGWLDWSNVVGGVTLFYLPMLVGGVVRLLSNSKRR